MQELGFEFGIPLDLVQGHPLREGSIEELAVDTA